jgi:DICT domain-containing protein
MPEGPEGLSIGELAERTGVPAPTLRSWELRYGVPRPRRLAGGHRRYDDRDVLLIEHVLRLRAAVVSLSAAFSEAARPVWETEPSVFAGLRRRHPELMLHDLRKTTLLALTRAIEDECCARAADALLFASFERERYYRQSEQRWTELARTSRVVVFADFPAGSTPDSPVIKVPVPADAPLRREWVLVCETPGYPACVAAWEYPGKRAGGADRRFEAVWTADPRVVRDAATICARLAESFLPGLGARLGPFLSDPPPPASADLLRATSLLNRMTSYLEHAARE